MQSVTERDLKSELSEMRDRFPLLQDSDLFVAWFLKCFVTEKEQDAIGSLVGEPSRLTETADVPVFLPQKMNRCAHQEI
jgi:hypothetical protein